MRSLLILVLAATIFGVGAENNILDTRARGSEVIAGLDQGTGEVLLEWPAQADASGYRVERSAIGACSQWGRWGSLESHSRAQQRRNSTPYRPLSSKTPCV